ncbi:MAG: HEPN domain-containing protein, partial [Candidatus Tectomicrobia bacterium]|nr:HEPN domain-containing protein [Candidatus Tectomicrobia bacterium]
MALRYAQEALEAAQVCLDRQLDRSATSRAYYAMFWAAPAALASVGIQRSTWSHSGLQASFVAELIRRRKHYPATFGQHLHRVLQLRLDADYRSEGVSHRQETAAVRWAAECIAAMPD